MDHARRVSSRACKLREYQDNFPSSFSVIATVRMDEVIYIVGSSQRIITVTVRTMLIWRLAQALVSVMTGLL